MNLNVKALCQRSTLHWTWHLRQEEMMGRITWRKRDRKREIEKEGHSHQASAAVSCRRLEQEVAMPAQSIQLRDSNGPIQEHDDVKLLTKKDM